MYRILLSNDDGIDALGLKSLLRKMKGLGEVVVVAPDRERSTASHALTLHRPLRITRLCKNSYVADGTPSDCINLAINEIMKNNPPHIVISGINHGANLGDDIIYSGTVAAAMEGTMLGIAAIATSLVGDGNLKKNFEYAADFVCRLAKKVLKNGLPSGTFLNVNIPLGYNGDEGSYTFTTMGKRLYSQIVEEKLDPRGKKYYWIGGTADGFRHLSKSDCNAISEGKISITPIKLDLTDYRYLRGVGRWNL